MNLRPIAPSDEDFLAALYAASRADEMARVPWPDEQKAVFLRDQFAKQHLHYSRNYPGADLLLVELGTLPIGRVYVYRSPSEIRLMDIALVPRARGCGIGTALMRELIDESCASGARITLHVEPDNRAKRLYARLGFSLIENRGVYDFMARDPAAS